MIHCRAELQRAFATLHVLLATLHSFCMLSAGPELRLLGQYELHHALSFFFSLPFLNFFGVGEFKKTFSPSKK